MRRLDPLIQSVNRKGLDGLIFQRLFWGALAGCLVAIFFSESPLLASLETNMLELRYQIADQLSCRVSPAAGKQPSSNDICIVAFDDESQYELAIARFNNNEAQKILSKVLRIVERGKPTLIAIDLDLRGATNSDLAELLTSYPNIILATFGSFEGSSDLPIAKEFLTPNSVYGYHDLPKEPSGLVVQLPIRSLSEGTIQENIMPQVPSFTEATLLTYSRIKHLSQPEQLRILKSDQPLFINYQRIKYPTYSMYELLAPTFNPQVFAGKIIIIGSTLKFHRHNPAYARTPLRSDSPEAIIHADALNTLLKNEVIYSYPKNLARHVLVLIGGILGAMFSVLPLGLRIVLVLASTAVLLLVAQISFQTFHIALPVVAPLAMLGSGLVIGTLIFLDTDLRQRNSELAAARKLMQVRAEEERKRIAEDLHDDTLPALSSLARMTDDLASNFGDHPAPVQMREKLDLAIQEMRNIINDLHPSVLETMGFIPALENLTRILAREKMITARFINASGKNFHRIPVFTQLQLYRMVQEALNNVSKHSQSNIVEVRVKEQEELVMIQVVDNGLGMNRKSLKPDSHGLVNIRHRAQLIGADVAWKTPQEFASGTELEIKITLPSGKNNAEDNVS